jgi:uncharacterized membrane protein
MERPKPARAWLITPLVAVVVTILGAIVLFTGAGGPAIWLAACGRGTFIGCGLASTFICAAAVVICAGVVRRDGRVMS